MRRKDFELASESKYRHLQLFLNVCRRGEDGLLPKEVFCVATLFCSLEQNTVWGLIWYAHFFIRITEGKKSQWLSQNCTAKPSINRKQVFLMHLMPFSAICSQIWFAGRFLGTHSATWSECCLVGCQQKRLIISAGSWCQAGRCRAINSKLFHHLLSGKREGNVTDLRGVFAFGY